VNTLITQFGAESPLLFIDIDGDGVMDREMPITNQFPGGGGPLLLADLNRDGQVTTRTLLLYRAALAQHARIGRPTIRLLMSIVMVSLMTATWRGLGKCGLSVT
jgi:hypothetical protein